ncbi:MAG: DUF6427 family protein [Chitinophagaceae bacterium]
MIGIFKQKNQGNALLLLLYGLFLKFPVFLHPLKPSPDQRDSYLYRLLTGFLDPLIGGTPVIYSLLAFLLLFTQATLLNRISNSLKLFPKQHYLVGMSFLLLSSLMKEWSAFSAPLLVNSLLVWIWYRLISLYNNNNPKASIFDVAVLIGLLPLIYSPAIAFVFLLLLALIVTRPLRVTEWIVALLGLITPYYFLFVILFLGDQWKWSKITPSVVFNMPGHPSMWLTASIVILALPFFPGGYYVQSNLNKMMINIRKAWSLMLLFLIVSLFVLVLNSGKDHLNWMLVLIPLSTFHSAMYFYLPSRWLALLFHWVSFIFSIVVNYSVFR